MSAPGLTSPIRRETFKNLQLNAGMMLYNFAYKTYADATALRAGLKEVIAAGTNILGATRGGGSFTVTREIRTPEVDGKRYGFKGDKFVDSADAYLSSTLIEITTGTMTRLLGAAEKITDGKKTTIKMRTAFEDEDYLENLIWVGDLADGRLVAIVLFNALNTADVSLTFTDKGEGTMPAEFHAHQEEVSDYDYAPFEIIYFDKADEASGSESSADESEDGTDGE